MDLETLARNLQAPLDTREDLQRAAARIRARARQRVPVDSGDLQRSIDVRVQGDSVRAHAGGSSAPYGGEVNDRTGFMTSAVRDEVRPLARDLAASVKRRVLDG